jgi:hypothetical protein
MENKKMKQSSKDQSEKQHKLSYSIDANKNIDISKLEYDKPAYDKENNKYSLITFLSSKRKPDFYLNDKIIKAKFYKTKETKDEEEKEPQDSEKDELDIKSSEQRYFNTNLTIKCYNCGEVGHMSRNCPHDMIIICTRCNERGHDSFNCSNMKCFKCNKIGHRSFECKFKDIQRCERCGHNGHVAVDCLAKPEGVSINNNLKKCRFCGERDHLICPFPRKMYIIQEYDSDNVVFTDEEETPVEREKNREKLCPRCGGSHLLDRCKVRPPDNSFDKARAQFKRQDDDRNKFRKKQYRSDSEESFSHFRHKPNKYKRQDEYRFNHFK